MVTDFSDIYGKEDTKSIAIGKHSSPGKLDIFVDIYKLVLRHLDVLVSTVVENQIQQ